MEIVNIADIEGTLTELLTKVELGKEVIITRDGEAIAKLSPIPRQLPRRPLTSHADLRARQTLSKTSTLETLQALRREERY